MNMKLFLAIVFFVGDTVGELIPLFYFTRVIFHKRWMSLAVVVPTRLKVLLWTGRIKTKITSRLFTKIASVHLSLKCARVLYGNSSFKNLFRYANVYFPLFIHDHFCLYKCLVTKPNKIARLWCNYVGCNSSGQKSLSGRQALCGYGA